MKALALVFLLCMQSVLTAQTQPQTVLLWPDGAPGAQGSSDADKPRLTIYPVSGANKVPTGVVVCPGGGYAHLAMDHEGAQIAQWLNHLGISAYVLQYRLGPVYHFPGRALGCAACDPVCKAPRRGLRHS